VIGLQKLRYLIAAAEAGSFTRAARNLNIKQATLSRHIMEVESRLGLVMFDRGARGAKLTRSGRIYLNTARRIVKEFEELTLGYVKLGQGMLARCRSAITHHLRRAICEPPQQTI